MMTLNEFESALGRHGGALERWPEAERRAAGELVAADPAAARLLAQEQRVARALTALAAESPADAAGSAMIGRILDGIGKNRHAEPAVRPTRRLAAIAGAAMAASLVLGYVAGIALPANDGEDTLAGLMFGSSATSSDAGDVL